MNLSRLNLYTIIRNFSLESVRGKKVAFLLGSLNRGGTETLILDIFNYDQTCLEIIGIYRHEGDLSTLFHLSKTPIFKISPGRVWRLWLYFWRLRKFLIGSGVNIVHSHQRIDTIYAWLVCFGLKIKIIQTIHEFDFKNSISYKLLIHLSFIMADKDIFVSFYQKKYYVLNYNYINKLPLEVVYNGISFEKFFIENQLTLRDDLNLSDKSLLMGMVGNFTKGHDQMTICRFLFLLASLGVDFKFLFIGKKDLLNPQFFNDCYLFCQNNGLADKCLFLGSRSDVPAILVHLDAFLYSSDHDTFGISVIEAIATGIPVFVNDWDVMKEITENGERVILYKSKDEYDLLNKFNSYYSKPESYKQKAKENAKWAKETFSIGNHLKGLYSVYADIMK